MSEIKFNPITGKLDMIGASKSEAALMMLNDGRMTSKHGGLDITDFEQTPKPVNEILHDILCPPANAVVSAGGGGNFLAGINQTHITATFTITRKTYNIASATAYGGDSDVSATEEQKNKLNAGQQQTISTTKSNVIEKHTFTCTVEQVGAGVVPSSRTAYFYPPYLGFTMNREVVDIINNAKVIKIYYKGNGTSQNSLFKIIAVENANGAVIANAAHFQQAIFPNFGETTFISGKQTVEINNTPDYSRLGILTKGQKLKVFKQNNSGGNLPFVDGIKILVTQADKTEYVGSDFHEIWGAGGDWCFYYSTLNANGKTSYDVEFEPYTV